MHMNNVEKAIAKVSRLNPVGLLMSCPGQKNHILFQILNNISEPKKSCEV